MTNEHNLAVDCYEGGVVETMVDPMCNHEWDSLVATHPDCTFFHCAAWARALCKTYGHRALYFRYSGAGKTMALVPMMEVKSPLTGCRGVCLPFTDFCAPLVFDQRSVELVSPKIDRMARERRWKCLEIRGPSTLTPSASPSSTYYGHSLDLRSGPEVAFAGFSSSVRRAIRKGQRSNLTISATNTRSALVKYFRLHTETRRRHGVPPQSLSFFMNLYDEAIAQGFGFVVLASKGSQPIAGAVFLQFGQSAVYKYAASDSTWQELRGNNLVLWEAIKCLCQAGMPTLHFGRTALDNESLRRFKQGWGAREERIDYFRVEQNSGSTHRPRRWAQGFCTALFRRMPLIVNRWAGTVLYPHLD